MRGLEIRINANESKLNNHEQAIKKLVHEVSGN
jgi:hypothetical protein